MTATASQSAAERKPAGSGLPPAVSIQGVHKRFRLPHEQYHTLKQRALHPFASRNYDELRAVNDVSLDVAPGEFFGIVGRNGSGKSTLLKCLAGIYAVDEGEIAVRGRLSPFIELGVGFNQELTARDNVIINAIMLGLTRKQARERFDEIIAFAELEEFVDLKLKNYSSGMSVRLGFAVAVQVDADVLLVDEVLAVGDAAFQQKCFDQFEQMKAEGRTILFVTHDMGSVRRFCDRAMLLERGDVVDIGHPEDISRKYGELNFGVEGEELADGATGPGLPRVRVLDTWCENPAGEKIVSVPQGGACTVCVEAEFGDAVTDPVFQVAFRNDVRHTIFVPRSDSGGPTGSFASGQKAVARLAFEADLAPSRYTLSPAVLTSDFSTALDRRADMAALIVDGNRRTGGVADLPVKSEVRRP